jgi:DNA-binding XRE family transcriptional regulator
MRKRLATKIAEVRDQLEADDKQMARHLKMSYKAYKQIESGARVLPLPAQKSLEKRMAVLLDKCGLKEGSK